MIKTASSAVKSESINGMYQKAESIMFQEFKNILSELSLIWDEQNLRGEED